MRFGGLVANRDIDLTIPRGVDRVLIGPNGAGKTTLFNQLDRLLPPTRATSRSRGSPSSGSARTRSSSCGIARTYQNIRLFAAMSAIENVMVGAHFRMNRAGGRRS